MFGKKALILYFLALTGMLLAGRPVSAGFGISPPYVRSDKLIPGTRYEQQIMLLRSSAEDDLVANITVNAPEIESWLTIREGLSFDLPKDKLQVPMTVAVEVPDNAPLGNYGGHINVRVAPKQAGGAGVSVALGARIDIDLTLTNEAVPDFYVRAVKIGDMERLPRPWNNRLFEWFFYRLRAMIKIENVGNIDTAPSKVQVDITDLSEKKALESQADTKLKKVRPYETSDIFASFPTRLPAGQYWAKIKIYKGNDIVHSDKIAFTIAAAGAIPGYEPPYGYWPWLLLGLLAGLTALVVMILARLKIWRYVYRFLYLLFWPIRFIYGRLGLIGRKVKLRFWRWLHHKSARYQSDEGGHDGGKSLE